MGRPRARVLDLTSRTSGPAIAHCTRDASVGRSSDFMRRQTSPAHRWRDPEAYSLQSVDLRFSEYLFGFPSYISSDISGMCRMPGTCWEVRNVWGASGFCTGHANLHPTVCSGARQRSRFSRPLCEISGRRANSIRTPVGFLEHRAEVVCPRRRALRGRPRRAFGPTREPSSLLEGSVKDHSV